MLAQLGHTFVRTSVFCDDTFVDTWHVDEVPFVEWDKRLSLLALLDPFGGLVIWHGMMRIDYYWFPIRVTFPLDIWSFTP